MKLYYRVWKESKNRWVKPIDPYGRALYPTFPWVGPHFPYEPVDEPREKAI